MHEERANAFYCFIERQKTIATSNRKVKGASEVMLEREEKEEHAMWDKIRKKLSDACDVFELFMAVAVICGIIIAAITLWPELLHYWEHRMEPGAFLEYLDAIFNVVIGIEFMKMLCKPTSSNIIEVLIFLIARHMIVTSTTPTEDLISVISIGILFVFRRFMLMTKPDKNRHVPNIFGAIKTAQSPEFRDAVIRAEEDIYAEHARPETSEEEI